MYEGLEEAAITISKDKSSGKGFVTVHQGEGWDVKVVFPEFVPFSKTNVQQPFSVSHDGTIGTDRQRAFELVVELYSRSHSFMPYRFVDQSGNAWRLETSAAHWATNSKKFEWVQVNHDQHGGLRPVKIS